MGLNKLIDINLQKIYDSLIKNYIDKKVTDHTDITATNTVSGHVKVDAALNPTSTNPVQNKIVKAELDKKSNASHTHTKSQITDFPSSLKNPYALSINGISYDGSGAININLLPFVIGTQTSATGSWTGNAPTISALFDGLTIRYWLPYAGSGNATLNLTLKDGSTTGLINCYYGGTSRLSIHYPAGSIITLTYRSSVSIDGTAYTGWWADANYDSGNTQNTAGSTDTSSKIFLIGATSQAANPQTYSHDTVYVGTDGCLYSNSTKVSVEGHIHSYLPLSGGKLTGNLIIQRATEAKNSYGSANPTLSFYNSGADQNISLIFTDYDSVQAPSSLTLIGNQGGEYFIAPNIKATQRIYGNFSGDGASITGINASNISSGTLNSDRLPTVPVTKGGTGLTTLTSGQVLVGNGTGNVILRAIDTTTGGTSGSTSLITSGAVYAGLATKAASSHTHSYLPLSGGTVTGTISSSKVTTTYLAGNQGTTIINSTASAGSYVMLAKMNSTNGYFTHGTYQTKYLLQYTASTTVTAGTNSVTKSVTLLDESGNSSFPGTITASGGFSGNASTATKLATARTISLTGSVTGSGTFDGSSNLSIATSTNHTHNYAGSSSAGGSAYTADQVVGVYTLNGGAQPPSYISGGRVRFNMMNCFKGLSSLPAYADCILMDTYTGSDVPYVTGLGIIKASGNPRAFIAVGAKNNTSTWASQTELLTVANYNSYAPTKTGSGASGTWGINITGSAATLTNARTINGTSFNGSANITTASWGTARTITIGSTGKSVNGSGNVSWTLAEIGAAATSHTHSYLPLTGGTMTGNISFNLYSSTQIPLKVYGGDAYGQGISIGAGGATIVGGGESAKACESLLSAATEQLWLTSDGDIRFYTNCNTIGNKVGVILNTTRAFYPDTTNTGSLGTSDYKWANVYATTFNGALSGNASTATALTTSAGSATQPIYFSSGKPVACTYTLAKSVPSDAVFTDTKNMAGSTNTSSKIYLIGAASQATSIVTYSNKYVYVEDLGSISCNSISCDFVKLSRSIKFYYENSNNPTSIITETASGRLSIQDSCLSLGYVNDMYALSTESFISNNWVRTVGNTGWYSETYGGGWHMTDTAWIRSYNQKSVYIGAGRFYTEGGKYISGQRSDSWINVLNGTVGFDVQSAGSSTGFNGLARVKCTSGAWAMGALNTNNGFYLAYATESRLNSGTNGYDRGWGFYINGDTSVPGNIKCAKGYGLYSDTTGTNLIRQADMTNYSNLTCVSNTNYPTSIYTNGQVWKNGSSSTYFATTSSSDKRLKEQVSDMSAYEKVFARLSPVAFRYHEGLYNAPKHKPLIQWGFYAQDVIQAFKENGIDWQEQELVVVEDGDLTEEEKKYVSPGTLLKMNYQNLTALNTHMIQKNSHGLKTIVQKQNSHEAKIASLQCQLSEAKIQIAQQEIELTRLKEMLQAS